MAYAANCDEMCRMWFKVAKSGAMWQYVVQKIFNFLQFFGKHNSYV